MSPASCVHARDFDRIIEHNLCSLLPHQGHTYDNECNLNSNACWNDLNTTVVRMGPCEMPLIEFIVAEQEDGDYYVDGVDDDEGEGEEDYYGADGDLDDEADADVAMEDGCTAVCQDILGRGSVAFNLKS